MTDQVWISEVMSNGALGDIPGLRHKWFGEPWEGPYPHHHVPKKSQAVFAAICRHADGHTMRREEMPEASAVYSMPHFKRMKDVLFIGAFLGVRGKVAEVLSRFAFGGGGGLVPYTIYDADEQTPLPGPFYLVNFGPMKDCFLPEASTNVEKPVILHQTGAPRWFLHYLKDDQIAVSPAALTGSDLWMCPGVGSRIFMRDRVVAALKAALKPDDLAAFELRRCRVVG